MQGDPIETAIYNKLFEAKDAIASASTIIVKEKIRVDRRHMALKVHDIHSSTIVAKLVNGSVKWFPTLTKLDPILTSDFMMENYGL